MTEHAGIIRNETLLREGLDKLEKLKREIPEEQNEYYTLTSQNLITVAELIIRSAIYRKESRGGHYREDFPQSDDSYICHIVQQTGKEIRTLPVETHCKA